MGIEANQIQIPQVTTNNNDLNQVQQNINKVFRNLNNQVVSLQRFESQNTILGEIKIANLTQAQFQGLAGDGWLLCNGQKCVDTDYSKLTKLTVVPNFTVSGINTFIRVNYE